MNNKIKKAAETAVKILERNMEKYSSGDEYPAKYMNGQYINIKNGDKRGNCWTEGFWTGQLWLAYELSSKEKFKKLAMKNVEDFYKRAVDNIQLDWHHDTGFLYTPSCVSAYKLTGNELAKKAALTAAYSLSRRFRVRGEFIQSMNSENDAKNYKFIIDTMMNLPLLFWATAETGDESYRDKAIRHAETTRKYIIREDGSTYHHFLMDYASAGPVRGLTLQGAGDETCWSRGHSWMIYGSALMYGYTQDESWIDTFKQVTDYFLEHLPKDYVPYWDFSLNEVEGEPRDTSAAAIAICGIIEMATHKTALGEKMEQYLETAEEMLTALVEDYAVKYEAGKEGLLSGVTAAKPQGMDEDCTAYGDYFYMEALVRAVSDWEKYW